MDQVTGWQAQIARLKGKEGEVRALPAKGRLPKKARAHIIQLLAEFQPVPQVIDIIEVSHGLRCTSEAINRMKPGHRACNLSHEEQAAFANHRATFINDINDIGIAHQAVRLRTLDRLAGKAEAQGQLSLAASLTRQAAEELGGMLTNERRMKVSGTVAQVHLSVDDAKRELAMRLAGMVEDRALLPAPEVSQDS